MKTVRFQKPLQYKSKEIQLFDDCQIVVTTQNPNPCAVSGVRHNIKRRKFDSYEAAEITFNKMYEISLIKGWQQIY